MTHCVERSTPLPAGCYFPGEVCGGSVFNVGTGGADLNPEISV